MLPIRGILEVMRTRCEELAGERQRYADIFSLSPSAYLITDEHGHVLEANAAAGRLLEREIHFIRGKPLDVLLKCRKVAATGRPILGAHGRRAGHCWLLR